MGRDLDDARSRRQKAEAEAFALLSALSSRGRLAPLPVGTVVRGRYRVERYLRGSDVRNLYVVTLDERAGSRPCWDCGFEDNPADATQCSECSSDLGGRQFMLSERWRTDFQPYLEVHEMGFMHPGIATVYEVFEDSQRLFILSEYVEGHFLADMGSPISRKDIFDITFRGCEILDFLHEQGVILGSLGKEQVVLHDGEVMFHDLDFAAFQGQTTSEAQQKIHVERLGRMVREFIPPDLPALRALFDEVAEARITSTTSLARNLRALSARLPSADGPTHYAGMSDVGMVRTLNEDNWGWEKISEDVSIYVVADGMGGHDGGEIASELAVKTIIAGVRRRLKERPTPDDRTLENLLDEAFQEANNTIKGFSEKRRSDMGTTLVGILLNQRSKLAYVANVGDSRCYLVRGSELMQLTQDHSLVANLVAMGKISKQAAKNHPHSNILIRTVGKEWDIEIDIFRQDFKPGDLFLLCSDGLWGEVDEADILALIRDNPEPRAACQELVRAANRHGGHDNVTALVVKTN